MLIGKPLDSRRPAVADMVEVAAGQEEHSLRTTQSQILFLSIHFYPFHYIALSSLPSELRYIEFLSLILPCSNAPTA